MPHLQFFCYFCNHLLNPDDKPEPYLASKTFICSNCPEEFEQIIYGPNNEHLTILAQFRFNEKLYELYLYPTYHPNVLLKKWHGNEILRLPSMKDFTPQNMRDKVERILKMKAFL